MKKALRQTQTLHAGCSKVEPKNFAPQQTLFQRGGGQNLISWRWSLPLPTNPVWWGSMHAISSYRGNRPTNTQTHAARPTQTGPIIIHCTAKLSAQHYGTKRCCFARFLLHATMHEETTTPVQGWGCTSK